LDASLEIEGTSRRASYAFFLAAGIGIEAWAACLPAISIRQRLSNGETGLVLLCFATGAIFMMRKVGRLILTLGTANICAAGAGLFGAALIVIPYAGSTVMLAFLVAVAGAAFGALDVAMNTEASFLERKLRTPIMASFHAIFSLGSLAGAGLVGWLLHGGGGVVQCLSAAGTCVIAFAALGRLASRPHQEAGHATPAVKSSNSIEPKDRRLLRLLAVLAFLSLFAEGALCDWIAIYLVDTIGSSESTGAFGFALFAGMMAVGRGFGDAFTRWLDAARTLTYGAFAVAVALGFALCVTNIPLIFIALAVSGLGIANVVPTIFSAAGRFGGQAAGVAISRVATMGYAGLLAGPPFIGFVAQATSLTIGLTFAVIALVVVAFNGSVTRS
jgi:fucose permease